LVFDLVWWSRVRYLIYPVRGLIEAGIWSGEAFTSDKFERRVEEEVQKSINQFLDGQTKTFTVEEFDLLLLAAHEDNVSISGQEEESIIAAAGTSVRHDGN
jgi:hypothetical protein